MADNFENVGVRAVVEGFGSYMRNLGRMDSRTKGFGGTVGKLGKTAAAMGLGFVAAQASMVGVQTIMSKSIGAALKYEAQLAEIRALTGATAKDTKLLDKSIKDMARRLPKSPAELGAGAYFILSSGIEDAAEAAEVLEVAAKASVIGLGETADVANALTTVLNAYGLEASEAGHVTDVLIQAVKEGKAEAGAFAGVLGRVVPLAAQMGISFEEVAANLATFTRLGVSADEAATGLRQVMASMLKPTEDQEEAMEELGFTAEGLRKQIREKGLLATLDAMTTATGGNEAAIARLFPNIRALTSVLGTAGVQLEDYTDILASTQNATGNLEEGLAIVSDTAQLKMQMAMQELNLALLDLGEKALPAVVEGAKGLSTAIRILTLDMQAWKGASIDVVGSLKDVVLWNIKGGVAGEQLGKALGLAGDDASELSNAIDDQIGILKKDAEELRKTGMSAGTAAEETSKFDTQVAALAARLGLSEQMLRDSGKSIDELRDETKELSAEIARSPAAWQAFDKSMADAARTTFEIETGFRAGAAAAGGLTSQIKGLTAAIQAISGTNDEMMKTLTDLTGARTMEQNAIDQQINALALEENAALQAEVGQSNLGGATASTTDAIDAQIEALKERADSTVPQAIRDEVAAFEKELRVLQLARAEIESQINARNRLATALLEMARVANLPALAAQKKLELDRAKILQTVGGNTEDLTEAQQDAIAVIDEQIKALQADIDVRTLEAEVTNLQAEASDENREAMQEELNELLEQIGATEDLKRERELLIDTLEPTELLNEIKALEEQRRKMKEAESAAKTFGGAIQTASDKIGDQITKLELERDKLDIVKEGWELVGKEMLELPTLEDISTGFEQFKELFLLTLFDNLRQAIAAGDISEINRLGALIPKVGAIGAQHGVHGTFTGPQGFFIEPGRTERVDITPQGQVAGAPALAPSAPPQAALPPGGGDDPAALAAAMAFALQGMTVEMDGRVVGSLVNDRLGDRTFQLARGG